MGVALGESAVYMASLPLSVDIWQWNSMELAHSLLLNEEALTKIPDAKRPVFIFEWLRFLDKVLVAAQKV